MPEEKEPLFLFERLAASLVPFFALLAFFGVLVYAFTVVIKFETTPYDDVEFVQDIRQDVEDKGRDKVVTLDKPHVTDGELKNWISMAVSESLTFSKDNFSKVLGNIETYYTQDGFKAFEDYIISSGIAKSIRSGDFDMGVYIEDPPLFLNDSLIDGKHKWLYQMPLAISFFPKNRANLAKDADKFVNRQVTLTLQITRAEVDEDPSALQIETWKVSARRK